MRVSRKLGRDMQSEEYEKTKKKRTLEGGGQSVVRCHHFLGFGFVQWRRRLAMMDDLPCVVCECGLVEKRGESVRNGHWVGRGC